VGGKEQQGDHRTPEGHYLLDRRNAKSRFYKSIHVSYPNEQDKQRAAQRGVSPGGDIMIHGLPNRFGWLGATHRAQDWTDGCVAVTNEEMAALFFAPRSSSTPANYRASSNVDVNAVGLSRYLGVDLRPDRADCRRGADNRL
jgi:murein L,D-transpeptidase YafK